MIHSRRVFLKQLSTAAGVGVLSQLPAHRLWALAPNALVPDLEDALLRELAGKAIDAARAAGATFADVRIGSGQLLSVGASLDRTRGATPRMGTPDLALIVGYGVRVVVDGAWGFASGDRLAADDVARTARLAVARARANRPRRARTLELAPAPRVADGRWVAPIERDPFAISAGTQGDAQLAAIAGLAAMPEITYAMIGFTWQRANRLFASTDGTLLLQRTAFAMPEALAAASDGTRTTTAGIEGLEIGPYGYEAVSRVDLADGMRRAAERAIEELRKPVPQPTPVEVGRYDLVVSAPAMASLLTATLTEALQAERVLGYQANRAGTSFAAPPADVLGKYQVGSKLLTLRADRTRPHGAATVGWDDEGVAAEAFTLVQDGAIVDYLTSRQTAAELAAPYRARGAAVRSHGCASGGGQENPGVRLPNLTLEPATETATVDDLVAGVKRGFYVAELGGGSDQQVLSGQFGTGWTTCEIRDGKLGGTIRDMAIQFITPTFWKSLDALGGPATASTGIHGTGLSSLDPLQIAFASVTTVPGRFRQVNVLNTGRTA